MTKIMHINISSQQVSDLDISPLELQMVPRVTCAMWTTG